MFRFLRLEEGWHIGDEVEVVRLRFCLDILLRFGKRVRELRQEQGHSQENFAYACGLDRTYMGGIERGERNLALRNIEKIADTLGIPIAELMEGV
jgi:DNA-binding XRE family transcriptional regulator